MTERLYSRNEVNLIFPHIHSRTLRSWIEAGLVGWADERMDGRGVHRLFTIGNLYQIAIVAELTPLLPLDTIRNLMGQYFKNDQGDKDIFANCFRKILIISIANVKRKDRFPIFRTRLITGDDVCELLPQLMYPTDHLVYSSEDEIKIRPLRPPKPSTLIVVNLSEIVDNVARLIEKAELN